MGKLICTLGLALLVTVAACGDDNKLTFGAMAGTWNATEYLYIDAADDSTTYDVLAGVGVALGIEVRANGTVIILIDGTPVDSSTATLQGDVVNLNTGGGDEWRVALNADNMTWTSLVTIPYDFDADGTSEDAFQRIRWHRN